MENRITIVTGGLKGIGKAVVEQFLELGATVIFTARYVDTIKATLNDLKSPKKWCL